MARKSVRRSPTTDAEEVLTCSQRKLCVQHPVKLPSRRECTPCMHTDVHTLMFSRTHTEFGYMSLSHISEHGQDFESCAGNHGRYCDFPEGWSLLLASDQAGRYTML